MTKFGLSLAVTLIFFFAVSPANTAYANNLEAKWTQPRQVANNLGDAAKSGDESAYATLSELAKRGDNGPAMHNMGWLLDVGFYGGNDKQAACDWYKKATTLTKYPPSMHNYALCLFRSSKDWKSDEKAIQGRQLMQDAAKLGWTNSAILLSEKILNYALLSQEDANRAMQIAYEAVHNTQPSQDEFSTLHYFVGMAAVYGPRDIANYRTGHKSMLTAISAGHPLASDGLDNIETLWVNDFIRRSKWVDKYETSTIKEYIEDCYDNLADKDYEDHLLAFCKKNVEITFNNVEQLSEDSDELFSMMIMGEIGDKFRVAAEKIRIKSPPYRTAHYMWKTEFIPNYNARTLKNQGSP